MGFLERAAERSTLSAALLTQRITSRKYLILVGQCFHIIGRRDVYLFLEDPAEIVDIVVADDRRNFRYIIVCALQQSDCVIDADRLEILHGSFCCVLLECPEEIADAHIVVQGIFFKVDIFIIMLLEIAAGDAHLLLDMGTDDGLLIQPARWIRTKICSRYMDRRDS